MTTITELDRQFNPPEGKDSGEWEATFTCQIGDDDGVEVVVICEVTRNDELDMETIYVETVIDGLIVCINGLLNRLHREQIESYFNRNLSEIKEASE